MKGAAEVEGLTEDQGSPPGGSEVSHRRSGCLRGLPQSAAAQEALACGWAGASPHRSG